MADDVLIPLPADIEARFWAKVSLGEPKECWLWTGASNGRYGVFGIRRRLFLATHVSLHIAGQRRPFLGRNNALHSDQCRSTLCINPAHLRWGSQAENMQDRDRLGRPNPNPRIGSDHPNAKLSEDQVRAIRASSLPAQKAAKAFGIGLSTVYAIRTRRIWAHLA